ncbi:sensor histidine kinase [Aurantiacibacter xanthus]|uniref:histidine kinase n=1 Tax=Aurantiacibacter xanthus TaxID=1784712 RepID=A0A3A1P368_9SPHN|nr:ATP-binding protein [Aurantiacibacter xanthus]RIV82343.1 sensor histidine kinase [Aurantiacibacter xanthus]
MKPLKGLGRHVALSMGLGAFMGVLSSYLGIYLLYLAAYSFYPNLLPKEDNGILLPTTPELLVLALVAALVLLVTITMALRLAGRIVAPLASVAQAARRISEGDLTARAQADDDLPGEAALLVSDFNSMADRLEEIAHDVITWNAQIAHELRTPLTILRGRLLGMIDGVFSPDDAQLHRLLKQVEGLSRLVEDLRIVSLLDSGEMRLERIEVDLAREIAEFGELVEPGLVEAGFSLTISPAPGKAVLDMTRIRQALLALVDNAQRHANPCDLCVEASMHADTVEIRVVDQGPGLPDDFARDAFKLFAQGKQTEGGSRAGSGLGLSVVQAIAKAHGGSAFYGVDGQACFFALSVPRWAPPSLSAAAGAI